jgi:hypothetical protein
MDRKDENFLGQRRSFACVDREKYKVVSSSDYESLLRFFLQFFLK